MAASGPTVIPPGSDEDYVSESQISTDAIAILNRSEIEVACEIAHKYPRTYEKFRQDLERFTCTTPAVAATMFYAKPVAGTSIIGPGVRFAEVLKTAWRNTRTGLRIIGERGDVAIAQGLFFDAETNTGLQIEAQRSILTKEKKKFGQDMIVTTGNAAASVAYRNAIFRGVPRGMWDDLYEKTRIVAVGEAASFVQQVNEAVEAFSKQGVTLVMLLNNLGCPSVRDITPDNIIKMRSVFSAIKKGEMTIEDAFGSPDDKEIEDGMDQLGWNGAKKNMSRQSFKGRRAEHLALIRQELAKLGRVAKAPTKASPGKSDQDATAGEMAQGRAAVSEQPPDEAVTTSAPENVVKAEAAKPTEEEAW